MQSMIKIIENQLKKSQKCINLKLKLKKQFEEKINMKKQLLINKQKKKMKL